MSSLKLIPESEFLKFKTDKNFLRYEVYKRNIPKAAKLIFEKYASRRDRSKEVLNFAYQIATVNRDKKPEEGNNLLDTGFLRGTYADAILQIDDGSIHLKNRLDKGKKVITIRCS